MPTTLKPQTPAQVADAVRWALSAGEPHELLGAGTKRGLGRPVQATHTLDLSGLYGITLYEPAELVMSARAGTPLAEIEAALAGNRQMLAFEPPDLGPLYGAAPGMGTIGGTIACNLSGPRRFKAGAARDHFLGFSAVSGRGEAFKAGGRVVKNVTGYDLSKLMAGSYGTLAALTDVTFKVLPAPEKTRTLLLLGLDDAAANRAMTRALQSPHDVSGAAHLPRAAAAGSAVDYVAGAGASVTALRLEGPGPSVQWRCATLRQELADLGAPMEELHSLNSARFWREVRDLRPLAAPDGGVWRLSVPPATGAATIADIVAALSPSLALPRKGGGDSTTHSPPPLAGGGGGRGEATSAGSPYFYDWGGALVWLALPARDDAGGAAIRATVAKHGGHATLMRAPADVRVAVPVFQPEPEALAALSRRVKESFDPHRILNPGRMAAGL
jgi:glycolate oxidase FAD binding subunit